MPSCLGSPGSWSHSTISASRVSFEQKPALLNRLEVGKELKNMKQVRSSDAKSIMQRGTQLHIFLEYTALKSDSLFWVRGGSSIAAILSYLPSYQWQPPFHPPPSSNSQVIPSCFLPGNSLSFLIFSDNHLDSSDPTFLLLAAFNTVSNTHLPKC